MLQTQIGASEDATVGGLSAPRDLPVRSSPTSSACARPRARRSPSASRRSARPSATRSRRATSPSARASSSRPRWSSSATPPSARSGSSTGAPSASLPPRPRLRREIPRARNRTHDEDELAHYARAAVDVEFLFPFGWQEIEGIHDRGDWDLSRTRRVLGQGSGDHRRVTKEHYTPMVIETSVGVDRTCLALLVNAYEEETLEGGESAHRDALPSRLGADQGRRSCRSRRSSRSPATASSGELRRALQRLLRRFRQHRPPLSPPGRGGTPFCITYDFDSAEDGKVTVRDRDTHGPGRASRSRGSSAICENGWRSACDGSQEGAAAGGRRRRRQEGLEEEGPQEEGAKKKATKKKAAKKKAAKKKAAKKKTSKKKAAPRSAPARRRLAGSGKRPAKKARRKKTPGRRRQAQEGRTLAGSTSSGRAGRRPRRHAKETLGGKGANLAEMTALGIRCRRASPSRPRSAPSSTSGGQASHERQGRTC